ncbi:MAG TPA: hypothetical protein VMR14_12070 [Streptosporangiaceae bacterium]|nr:hypothetical protein [Streptosporangiaceae bacterium]
MGTETNVLALPDGRQLCYALAGDPRGYPVIGLHGTPGGGPAAGKPMRQPT